MINDHNLDLAIDADVIGIIFECLDLSIIKSAQANEPPIFLKYAMRCLASTVRKEQSIARILIPKDHNNKVSKIVEIVNFVTD